jgi:RNA polymerase sigma-70 factor (ECF subfamily)
MHGGVSPTDEAFVVFYTTYFLTVLTILRRIGVRKADVQDIAQHVFLKIHKNFNKLPTQNIDAWIYRICVQQAAEHYRLHRNRLEIPEAHVGEDMLDDVDIHEQFERCELTAIVKQILAGMDAKLGKILVRHEFKGESLEHIAEALGISRNTVQSRLVEAKRIFRLRASKVLGDNRSPMPLLLPFGAETLSDADLQSPAFVENMRKQVWQGIAHELGFDETPAVKLPTSTAPKSNEPTSLRKRILRRIFYSGVHLGVGATAGFIAALYWPRELPIAAKHLAMVIPVINVQNHETAPSPSQSAEAVPTVVTTVLRSPASMGPEIDRETQALERARELIASGQYSEALAELARHEKQFPQSQHAAARNRYAAIARERQPTADPTKTH